MYFSSTSIIYSPKYDKLFFSTANSGRIKRIFSSGAAHTFLWSAAGALCHTAAAMPSLEVLQGHCASLQQPCPALWCCRGTALQGRSHAQTWSAAGRCASLPQPCPALRCCASLPQPCPALECCGAQHSKAVGLRRMPEKGHRAFCEQAPNGSMSFLRRMAYVSQKVHVHALTVSLVFHIINLRISGNYEFYKLIQIL